MVVYAKFNLARKPRFQLATSVLRRGDGLATVKQARNPDASAFLERMVAFARDHQTLSPGLRLARIESHTDSTMVFEHVAGQSFHTRALLALRARKSADFIETLRAYDRVVSSLAVQHAILDERFSLVFGDALTGEHALLTQGLFDLNCDNLIATDDGTVVIDYEWTFDFPVPKAYVMYRALMYLYTSLHEYNPHEALTFDAACELLHIPTTDVEAFQKTEHAFQQYVLGKQHVPPLTQYVDEMDHLLSGNLQPQDGSRSYERLRTESAAQIQQLNDQLARTIDAAAADRDANMQMKQRIQTLDRTIFAMEQSHFWKLRNRYIKIKDALRRR